MKKIIVAAAVFASLGLAQSAMAADGTVNFTGQVANSACAISGSSTALNVNLGEAKLATLNSAKVANLTPFAIQLTDCDPSIAKTVTTTFTGNNVSDANGVQALVPTAGAGAATGVAIEILDATGVATPVALPVGTASNPVNVSSGAMTLNYAAQFALVGTAATVGTVNAVADYTLTYK